MGISFVKNCGIIKLSVKKANCIDNTGVKGCNAMKEITKETLLKAMKSRDAGEHPVFRECEFKDMDLSGMNLHNMDFTLSSFQNVNLERVNFENCSVENALFDGNSLHGANFQNANMKTAAFRGCVCGNATSKEPTFTGQYWSTRSWMTFSQMKQRSGSACTVRRPDDPWL